jgi:dipeptidyl aminopeptidase/acylaminoacyl peptidase
MGGGVTTDAITVAPRIKAAVIYAPTSADKSTSRRWQVVPRPGPTKVSEPDLTRAYMQAGSDWTFMERASPINYFHLVTAPVQIHSGTHDAMTPQVWAKNIFEALQVAEKEVDFFTYDGQGHALHGEHWELFMQRVTEFFDQHVKLEGVNHDAETQS